MSHTLSEFTIAILRPPCQYFTSEGLQSGRMAYRVSLSVMTTVFGRDRWRDLSGGARVRTESGTTMLILWKGKMAVASTPHTGRVSSKLRPGEARSNVTRSERAHAHTTRPHFCVFKILP